MKKNLKKSDLSPLEKTAILLSVLGPKATELVFKQLPANSIKIILEHMKDLNKVHVQTARMILQEFYEAINEERDYLFPFRATPDLRGGDQIFHSHQANVLDALEGVDSQVLSNFLTQEHPQTVALIMIHLPVDRKTEIFKRLPPALQTSTIIRMGEMEDVSPANLAQLNEVLRHELALQGSSRRIRPGGVKEISKMFQLLGRTDQEKLLSELQVKDENLATQLRDQLFVFDDLAKLSDHDIQIAFKYVDPCLWSKALKVASLDLSSKIFQNMSHRAAIMLKEDILAHGLIRRSVVEKAQKEIVEKLKELEARNKISLNKVNRQEDPLV